LLAALFGLLKTTKDQLIKHYHKGKWVFSLCHVTDSLYLVGFFKDGLILWNEQTDQLLYKICSDDRVFSIKRVLTTNNYIIKTEKDGVKVLTINDLESFKFSVQHLLDAIELSGNLSYSLQVQITNCHITIAATHNPSGQNKIKLMKVPIAA
jgi:hypothetical protein